MNKDVSSYINQKKYFYNLLLAFIDKKCDSNDETQLFDILQSQKLKQNRDELKELIQIISNISNDHHRSPYFFAKIQQILLFFKENIKQTFSNSEIFDFFLYNKEIHLLLFNNEILALDELIIKRISKMNDYCHFFMHLLQPFITKDEISSIKNEFSTYDARTHENKCKIGENDSYICSLIRNDSIEEFVAYVNQTNYSLSSRIEQSFYETNSFLIVNKPTLIEYAAFFGSIQIIQYLRMNHIEMSPSLWMYAIHSNCADLIHLLEENKVAPYDNSYEKCFEEAIKCNHNEIANYIINQYIQSNEKENETNTKHIEYGFCYHNYSFIPDDINDAFAVYCICKYNYINLVKLFLNTKSKQIESLFKKINEIICNYILFNAISF